MRHRKVTNSLSRKRDPRRALIKNLAASIILHEKVKTTEAKAKVMRPIVEKLITHGKEDTLAARRYLIARLPTNQSVNKIIEILGPRYKNRAGGYTRITKLNRRSGDAAKQALIEFV